MRRIKPFPAASAFFSAVMTNISGDTEKNENLGGSGFFSTISATGNKNSPSPNVCGWLMIVKQLENYWKTYTQFVLTSSNSRPPKTWYISERSKSKTGLESGPRVPQSNTWRETKGVEKLRIEFIATPNSSKGPVNGRIEYSNA